MKVAHHLIKIFGLFVIHVSLVKSQNTPSSCLRDEIANVARKYIGGKRWTLYSSYGPGRGVRKEGWFVRDILREAGAVVPNKPGSNLPLEPTDWKNRANSALRNSRHWQLVNGAPEFGDVAAGGKNHLGIIIDEGQAEYILRSGKRWRRLSNDRTITTSLWKTAQTKTKIGVIRSDFGFTYGMKTIVFWRYTC